MASRSYFDYRFSLPGFSFLLIIVLINLRFLIYYSVEKKIMFDLMGLMFGFISLLSGSALGFLISQFWYFIFNYVLKINYILKKRPHYSFLIKNFENYKEKDKLLSLMNYMIISLIKDKRMSDYITRRTDLFNILGATGTSLFLGFVSGIIINMVILKKTITGETYVNWCRYNILIFISILIVLLIIFLNMVRIWKETDTMVEVLISFSKDQKDKLNSLLGFNYKNDEHESK